VWCLKCLPVCLPATQDVAALGRGLGAMGEKEAALRSRLEEVEGQLERHHLAAVPEVEQRVGQLEEHTRRSTQRLDSCLEELPATLSGKASARALQDLQQKVQRLGGGGGGGERRSARGGAAAGFKCLVCDSTLPGGGIAKPQPHNRAAQAFTPSETLNPELFFGDQPMSSGGVAEEPPPAHERRPRSAAAAVAGAYHHPPPPSSIRPGRRAATPPDERVRALQHGRQPPAPGSGGRRVRPASAGPLSGGAQKRLPPLSTDTHAPP
jgi:hypothetical protein